MGHPPLPTTNSYLAVGEVVGELEVSACVGASDGSDVGLLPLSSTLYVGDAVGCGRKSKGSFSRALSSRPMSMALAK